MGKLQFGPALTRGWQIFTKDPLNLILGAIVAGVLSLTVFLFPVMIAGYVYLTSRIARGEKAELRDLFFGFNDVTRYLLGGLICVLTIIPPLLLFRANESLGAIGGALIAGILLPFWPLMVLKNLTGPDAFKEGLEFYKKEYLTATIFGLLFMAVSILIVIRYVGIVSLFTVPLCFSITVPLCFSILMAVYEQYYGFESEDEPTVISVSS